MKIAIIFLALFATCAAWEFQHVIERMSKLGDMWKTCVVARKISDAAISRLMKGQCHEETNGARVCFMREAGIMADDKINITMIEKMANACPWLQLHPHIKDTMIGVLKGCYKTAASAADVYEMAGKMCQCYKDIGDRIKAIIVEAAAAGA